VITVSVVVLDQMGVASARLTVIRYEAAPDTGLHTNARPFPLTSPLGPWAAIPGLVVAPRERNVVGPHFESDEYENHGRGRQRRDDLETASPPYPAQDLTRFDDVPATLITVRQMALYSFKIRGGHVAIHIGRQLGITDVFGSVITW
jgi:hypothetical protein